MPESKHDTVQIPEIQRSPRHAVTEELRDRIVSLYEEGASRAAIQTQTNISQPTIRKILDDAGYPPASLNRTQVDDTLRREVKDLYDRLHNARKVAVELGLAARTVRGIIADLSGELKGKGEAVSAEHFIKTWQCNDSIPEVARLLRMNLSSVYSRAQNYRSKGVPLKRYHRSAYDWEDLTKFAELFLEPDGEQP